MQKLINALAILSFAGTASIVGGGAYLYSQKDAIIDNVKKQVTEAAIEGVSGALPGLLDSSVPELPDPVGSKGPNLLMNNDKITQGYNTYDSMGCMLLQECTEGVEKIESVSDLQKKFPNADWNAVADEFNEMLTALSRVNVNVYLSDSRYFPPGHRGVYHTVGNNFFLNKDHMAKPYTLMSVMRHEGWHAAQDCMAGTIENSMIAIIKPEEDVPGIWREIVEDTYPKSAVPWEAEATWAGKTEGMTMDALKACANENMWEVYDPTPMTKEWLVEKGYIKE